VFFLNDLFASKVEWENYVWLVFLCFGHLPWKKKGRKKTVYFSTSIPGL
jgi:hypothetical protein